MEFKEFKQALQESLAKMLVVGQNVLFVTDVSGDLLWDTYLASFPPGTNELYRERREYDCNCCRRFIKAFGNVVVVVDNRLVSIWDLALEDKTFGPVAAALSTLIHSAEIRDVLITKEPSFGVDTSKEILEDGSSITWEHFFVKMPADLVCRSPRSNGDLMGEVRTTKEVFKRALEEITQDAFETTLELIAQNSLPRGEEWEEPLKKFLVLHKKYHKLSAELRDNYCWLESFKAGPALARIKNHAIGTLLVDLSIDPGAEGAVDLDNAVRKYDKKVAGDAYKRPKPIFTKGMIEKAQQLVGEMGFGASLKRRFASLEDITINNVLFANRDAARKMKGSVFDDLKEEVVKSPKDFGKVEQISVEKFIAEVLPTATSLEALVENPHSGNFVSLIAPEDKDSKTMFKWGNNFSWAFNGNMAASMKEVVKGMGGNVDGVLRFSILWNDNSDNQNDFDAHCKEPDNNLIYFGNKGRVHSSSGKLDVDIIHPGQKVAVENIIYTSLKKMKKGKYVLLVHVFSYREGNSGFSAEVEFGGEIYYFEYRKPVRQNEKIEVAVVELSDKGFRFVRSLDSSTSSKDVWGIKTNQFVPVSACMFSPNYWDDKGVGQRHYFFMLKGCKNDGNPNGFFNEFLKEELNPHRKVFEALGSKMKVEDSDNQLSGLGFSSTKRNSLVCKVGGKVNRVVKVLF